MKRRIAAVAVAATTLVALLVGTSAAAPVQVVGTVGPGETIGLTSKGKKVTRLKAGSYRFVIRDRSDEHDFRLVGSGTSKVLAGVGFVGTKSVASRFRTAAARRYGYCRSRQRHRQGSLALARAPAS